MHEDFHEELRIIGTRIAAFRKMRNMTQTELADRLNINKNYLSHIENASAGKTVSLPMLIRISRALNVELALLTDVDDLHKVDFKNYLSDMRQTFEEMKKLNDDLDKMLEQLEQGDKFSSDED